MNKKFHSQGNHVAFALGVLVGTSGCYTGGPTQATDPDEQATDGSEAGDGSGDDGGDDSSDDPDAPPMSCGEGGPSAAARPLRRLTPAQLQTSMDNLLGLSDHTVTYDAFEAVIGIRGVRQLRDDAEAAVARLSEWPPGLLPCDLNAPEDATCPQAFIDTLAPLAFRRPLLPSESPWLMSIYDDARATMSFADAMEVLAEAILQAPAVVYFEEYGVPSAGSGDIAPLSEYELANRISFFLWNEPPDDALMESAGAAQLHSEAELRAQVSRMLDDPRAHAQLTASVWSALQLDGGEGHFALLDADKRPDLYPEYGLGLQYSMQVAFEAFVTSVLAGDATFSALMTSRRAYVDDKLAALYGVQTPAADGQDWHWVDLPADQRAGLLTRAAFLTVFANTATQSPIRRGTVTLEEVLCFELGAPPPDADDTPIEGGDHGEGAMTVREATVERTSEPQCNACHSTINPVGFLFEHYDAIGAWQVTEPVSGLPVDASAGLPVSDVAGDYADAVALSEALAGSHDARACFAERWLAEALGGQLGQLDACSKDQVVDAFAETGDLRQLVTDVVLSDSFRHINLGPLDDGE